MSDIAPLRGTVTLATVGNAATVTTAAATATVTLAAGTGNAIPPGIAQLGIGAVINGIVAERGPRGQITIRTDKGTLTLQTALALKLGSAVTLQIQSLGAQTQFLILSVDGQPMAGQSATATTVPTPTPGPAPQSSVPQTPASQSAPSRAQSVVVSLNTEPGTLMRPGLVVSGQLTLPSGGSLAHTAGTEASIPAEPSRPIPSLVAARSAAPAVEPVLVRILGIATSPATSGVAPSVLSRPTFEVAPTADAVTVTAVVADLSAEESAGTTLLRTPLGNLRLPLPPTELPGSRILLELLSRPDASAPRIAPQDERPTLPIASPRFLDFAQDWPALRETIDAVEQVAPQAAQQFLANSLPRVGPSLTAGLMLFVSMIRDGNLRHWFGDDAVDGLERSGKGAMLTRLADDVAVLPRLAEAQTNGWQTLLLPLFDGTRLSQIRLSLRRGRKPADGHEKEPTRFIVEADLSRLGPLQLDGFVKLPQFDLAVRTRDNLPPDMRADILELFNDALQATRLKGNVVFQTARDLTPHLPEARMVGRHGLTV